MENSDKRRVIQVKQVQHLYILLLICVSLYTLFAIFYHRNPNLDIIIVTLFFTSLCIYCFTIEGKLELVIDKKITFIAYLGSSMLFIAPIFASLGVIYGLLSSLFCLAINLWALHLLGLVFKSNHLAMRDQEANPKILSIDVKKSKEILSANILSIIVITLLYLAIISSPILKKIFDENTYFIVTIITFSSIILLNIQKTHLLFITKIIPITRAYYEFAIIVFAYMIQYIYEVVVFSNENSFSPYVVGLLMILTYPIIQDQKKIALYISNSE